MKQRPVGICNVCGNYAYSAKDIGQACRAHHHGESCNGVISDATAAEAWEACPACTGRGGQAVDCPQCAGAGWLPVA